jgi:hypothetical protein
MQPFTSAHKIETMAPSTIEAISLESLRQRAALLHARARQETANPKRREYFHGQAEMLETLIEELAPASTSLEPSSAIAIAESEIAVIRSRFRRLGYDMWVHPSSSDWSAWYYQDEPLTGSGRFAVGNTAVEACTAAWEQFEIS